MGMCGPQMLYNLNELKIVFPRVYAYPLAGGQVKSVLWRRRRRSRGPAVVQCVVLWMWPSLNPSRTTLPIFFFFYQPLSFLLTLRLKRKFFLRLADICIKCATAAGSLGYFFVFFFSFLFYFIIYLCNRLVCFPWASTTCTFFFDCRLL